MKELYNTSDSMNQKETGNSSFCRLLYYATRAGGTPRLITFAIIFIVNIVFIVLGSLGLLPLAAQITAVSLSGTAIGVIAIFNIISDISIIRSMFSAPGAVFYALTPVSRGKTLAVNVITMLLTDFVTMATSIGSVVILAVNLGSNYTNINFWESIRYYGGLNVTFALLSLALAIVSYLLFMMVIIFCIAVRKSIFYNKRAGGFLAVITGAIVFYIASLTPLLVAPFGNINWFFGIITVTVGNLGMGLYTLLQFTLASILFVITSKIMERKLNI